MISICNILGVEYDVDYLDSLEDVCKKLEYLLSKVYEFLGGK